MSQQRIRTSVGKEQVTREVSQASAPLVIGHQILQILAFGSLLVTGFKSCLLRLR